MRKATLTLVVLMITVTTVLSQFVITPIARNSPAKVSKKAGAKVRNMTPMLLPFWDDFSFSDSKYYPHDSLWQYGQSVTVNFGEGLKSPSIGVATFDGLDSFGKPYSINDPFAKGFTDSLVSRPINLDTVPLNLRTSVFLSFFFQAGGNGETPDPLDFIQLEFKNKSGVWDTDTTISNNGTLKTDTFYVMVRSIDSAKYFHSGFQFRFRSFGRRSGPYDTWNLDYIYMNSGRTKTDLNFPDRALATPMTSLFNEYFAIPKKHFVDNLASNLAKPSFEVSNMSGILQPVNYNYLGEVITYSSTGTTSSGVMHLEDTVFIGVLPPFSRVTASVAKVPAVALFDPAADSFKIKLKLSLTTKDNVLISNNGDYDSAIFKPIDFRVNDTTRSEHIVSNYYAYDDGSAEYGIGLNQAGARAAYLFEMKTPNPDTIVAVDIYFPRFGDETSQIIQLDILQDTLDNAASLLHKEYINVDRSQMDTLRRFKMSTNTIGVSGSFYISWTQSSTVSIPLGWDRNTDSGDKIFFNLNGHWEKNTTQHGSIMIHPVFGKGAAANTTGLPDQGPLTLFPNPNSGVFYLSGQPDHLDLFDFAGRPVAISSSKTEDQTRVEMNSPHPGVFVLKTLMNGKYQNQKVIVRP